MSSLAADGPRSVPALVQVSRLSAGARRQVGQFILAKDVEFVPYARPMVVILLHEPHVPWASSSFHQIDLVRRTGYFSSISDSLLPTLSIPVSTVSSLSRTSTVLAPSALHCCSFGHFFENARSSRRRRNSSNSCGQRRFMAREPGFRSIRSASGHRNSSIAQSKPTGASRIRSSALYGLCPSLPGTAFLSCIVIALLRIQSTRLARDRPRSTFPLGRRTSAGRCSS